MDGREFAQKLLMKSRRRDPRLRPSAPAGRAVVRFVYASQLYEKIEDVPGCALGAFYCAGRDKGRGLSTALRPLSPSKHRL